MARGQGVSVNSDFSKGLITESSIFNFPKNACSLTYDCIHNLDGSVERRPGFQRETNYSVLGDNITDRVITSYFWKDVFGDGNTSMAVVQIGDTLYFYKANIVDPYDGSPTDPLSSHLIPVGVDLANFSTAGAPSPSQAECQYTSGDGKLFISHPYTDPFAVQYNPDTNDFTTTRITIKIRDFEGVEDGLAIDTRPFVGMGAVTDAHHYNLLNQGWTEGNLAVWDSVRTDLPSNCDVMWTFKDETDVFNPTDTVANVVQGNSPAPKGHFLLDAFDKQRDNASGLSIADETAGYQRPSCIAFFAGRLFYAGTNYEGYNSNIYFTQIIERDDQFGQCYQVNDPTAETLFDLLPTDGGVITIQEAGTIVKLVVAPGGMFVITTNGTWLLTGSTGLGFTANDYTVQKISSIGAITASSFVDMEGLPAWWNLEGIYRIQPAQGGGTYQVASLTDATIKKEYDNIPPSEKRNARGYYNSVTKIVQWMYRNAETSDLDEYYKYTNILNLDLRTGGFYIWTIPDHDVEIHSLFVIENRGGFAELEDVTDNSGVVVTANDGSDVQSWVIGDAIVLPKFKYLISYLVGVNRLFTFAECADDINTTDWYDYDNVGTTYNSYFRTGYSLQNGMTKFQTNYVTLYVDNNSVLDFKGLWNFANSSDTSKWSVPQRIDSTAETLYDYKPYRRKVRGDGLAMQIQINSVDNEPFKLSGWAVFVTGNQTP